MTRESGSCASGPLPHPRRMHHPGTHIHTGQKHKGLFSSMAKALTWVGAQKPIGRGESGIGKAVCGLMSSGWGLSQCVLCVRQSSILLSTPRHTWPPLQGCLGMPSATLLPPAALKQDAYCRTVRLTPCPDHTLHCARAFGYRALQLFCSS